MSRRFFRHGELPLVLLALLGERPRHGYEVMNELARLFGPAYRPSPGSVYPAIEALEIEGLTKSEERAGRTTYRLTAVGRRALKDRAEMLAGLELRTGARLNGSDGFEPVVSRFRARIAPLSGRIDAGVVAAVLDRAADEIESLDRSSTQEMT